METMAITSIALQNLFLDVVGPNDRDDEGYQYIVTLQCDHINIRQTELNYSIV